MADPFVAEIRMFGFNFAPNGWATCDGQFVPIQQNTALFSLLGTNFGGNGTSTFGLPNLQGSAPLHWGQGPGLSDYVVGETTGIGSVTLLTTEMPSHQHAVQANGRLAESVSPNGQNLARGESSAYTNATPNTSLSPLGMSNVGGSQPHNNLQPYLVVNFCIALQGIFPPRS
jgi:microcystin-dependent protein